MLVSCISDTVMLHTVNILRVLLTLNITHFEYLLRFLWACCGQNGLFTIIDFLLVIFKM